MDPSDKPKASLNKPSFLAPSKLAASTPSKLAASAPVKPGSPFRGFKESKLSGLVGSSSSTSSSSKLSSSEAVGEPAAKKACFLPLSEKATKPCSPVKASKQPAAAAAAAPEDSNVTPVNQQQPSASTEFVFGQNFSDRVENFQSKAKCEPSSSSADEGEGEGGHNTKAPAEGEQSSATTTQAPDKETKTDKGDSSFAAGPSLNESAAAYVKSHSQKKPLDVPAEAQKTGEEDEENICQLHAKLHVFDKTGSCWQERGRGVLRLNDTLQGKRESRLVMRTSGSLRLILNSKLYKDMTIESPSEKSIRFTGYDDEGQIRVFLISGNPQDISVLFKAIQCRKADAQEDSNGEDHVTDSPCEKQKLEPKEADDDHKRESTDPAEIENAKLDAID